MSGRLAAEMKRVYCDTNVFDHIHKRLGVMDSDLRTLKSAIQRGDVSILLSVLNVEESLAAIKRDPTLAIRELWLILELADWNRILKSPGILVTDDIIAYAQDAASPQPFLDSDHPICAGLQTLRNPTQRDIDELLPLLDESKTQREDFRNGMRAARDQVLPYAKKLGGWQPPFDDYWAKLAPKFAEAFAERAGVVEDCIVRGIAGLLDVRSVRMAVGAGLSLAYAETFEHRTPKMGDSRDQQHAVLASAADVFVTKDRQFTSLLARIPIDRLQILDLNGFLETIR